MSKAFLICALLFFVSQQSFAAENIPEIEWQDTGFWAGFVGGIVTHELGHVAMAASFGQSSQLQSGSVVYPNSNFPEQQSLRVSTAGFQTQWLFSEWSFYELQKKEDTLLSTQQYLGLISAHLTISYVYMFGLKNQSTSDVFAAAQTSKRSKNQLAMMLMLPALLDTYRLLGQDVPTWVGYASAGSKVAEIGLIWTF